MSIATELSRIQADRDTIRAKLVELGMATNTDNLDALATAIEGLVNRGAVQVEILEGTSYTIPAGYHNGSGTVKAMTDTTGEAEKYKLQAKTATPTKSQQSVTPDSGYYGLSAVTVNPIPDAYQNVTSVTAAAGNVLTGKVFVTADGTVTTGTMKNNGAVTKTLDATTITYTIPVGYHNGSGKVTIVLETKTVTPTKATQSITPTSGKVLSKVTVNPIPDNFVDSTGATATAEQILDGQTAFIGGTDTSGNAIGIEVEGTMPNNGAVSKTLDINTTSYTVPKGYHNGSGKVQLVTETKSATPTKSTQSVTPTSGKVLSKVTVKPIPDNYIDTTDATAEAGQILEGETAYINTTKVSGTMPNNGAVSETLDTTTTSYTVPEGYHDGTGTVQIVPETKSTVPTKSVQTITPTSGKVLNGVVIDAIPDAYQDVTSVTAGAADVLTGKTIVDADGDVVEGTMAYNGGITKTLTTSDFTYSIPVGYHNGTGQVNIVTETKSATPTKSAQTITPTSGKVLSSVSVAAIPAAYQVVTNVTAGAGDVLSGKVIVDAEGEEITGTMANNGTVTKSLNTGTTSYTIPAGYHSGSGKVSIATETKTVTPTKGPVVVSPSAGKVLSKVTVNSIPSEYQDVTSVTAVAADVLTGKKIVSPAGDVVDGAMANNGDVSASIDGLTASSVTIPAGYTSGGTVSLTSDIEEALAAI